MTRTLSTALGTVMCTRTSIRLPKTYFSHRTTTALLLLNVGTKYMTQSVYYQLYQYTQYTWKYICRYTDKFGNIFQMQSEVKWPVSNRSGIKQYLDTILKWIWELV